MAGLFEKKGCRSDRPTPPRNSPCEPQQSAAQSAPQTPAGTLAHGGAGDNLSASSPASGNSAPAAGDTRIRARTIGPQGFERYMDPSPFARAASLQPSANLPDGTGRGHLLARSIVAA